MSTAPPSPQQLYARAVGGRAPEAEQALERLADCAEASADAILAAARLRFRRGRDAEAGSLLQRHAAQAAVLAALCDRLLAERRMEQAGPWIERLRGSGDLDGRLGEAMHRHREGDFAGAVTVLEQSLGADPLQPRALSHLGRALHNLGSTEHALGAFEQAVALDADYAEGWHNLGHALRARGQLHRAQHAFERAVELSPGFRSARLNLGITLYAMDLGAEALQQFQALLSAQPDDVEALINAGLCLHMLGRGAEARASYERALQLHPDHSTALYYYGTLCNELLDTQAALAALRKAVHLQPGDADAWAELAGVFEQTNRLDEMGSAVKAGIAVAPAHPPLLLEGARLQRRSGRNDEAHALLERIDPRRLPPRLAERYQFELGTVLDRLDRTDAAIQAFSAGNALAARSPRRRGLDPNAFFRRTRALHAWLTGASPTAEDEGADLGEDLCFLLGFPRSGTTLLDTMLDTHPDVASIEEEPTIEQLITPLQQRPEGYPRAIDRLQRADRDALRRAYREAVHAHVGARRARLLVDKLPMRTLRLGLIQALFPRARILFAARHPCDVVLSNFMQNYAANEALIHCDSIAETARTYDAVLGYWWLALQRLPLNYAYVRYEGLIADATGELQRTCEFLGVDFRADMLDDAARLRERGRIRTSSYAQVAEPLYRRAAGRWQRYRRHLEPVLPVLAPHAERLGYSLEPGPAGSGGERSVP